MHTPIRATLLALLLAAVISVTACGGPPPQSPFSGAASATIEPAIITVRLDVTGTGTGIIRYSTDHGTLTDTGVVLYSWSHTYLAATEQPIVLEVRNRADLTADCAVHINGELRTSATGINPICTVTRT